MEMYYNQKLRRSINLMHLHAGDLNTWAVAEWTNASSASGHGFLVGR